MAEDAIILAVLAVSLVLKSTSTGSGPEGKPDRLQAILSWKVRSGLGLKTCVKVDNCYTSQLTKKNERFSSRLNSDPEIFLIFQRSFSNPVLTDKILDSTYSFWYLFHVGIFLYHSLHKST